MTDSPLETATFRTLTDDLRRRSADLESAIAWPADSWTALADAGVLRWFVPVEFGGTPIDAAAKQSAYLELAAACLTTTFILTQRNAAVARIALSDNQPLKTDLLTRLAGDRLFATVGISHLTTSRQHLRTPAVEAIPQDGGWVVRGQIPWVTGAHAADVIVTGGVQPDGLQVLVALDTKAKGVEVQSSPKLLALNESDTTSVTLNDVFVPADKLLLGPDERVLKAGGAGGLTTSALALGRAQASIAGIEAEAERREDLCASATSLRETLEALKADLAAAAAAKSPGTETLEALRRRSNSLVLRSAQAYLTASKGAGFLAAHPAARAVREAQFFLVWSCPQPVTAAALAEFACPVA